MRRFTASVLLLLLPTLQAEAAIDTIIPMPKSIREVGQPVPLDGFRIVTDNTQRARIGASEINERIRSLGGEPLPVLDLEESLPNGKLIVISPCTAKVVAVKAAAMEVTPKAPGRQGYVIHPEGSSEALRLYLIGSDTLGTLYAAETCRQLIIERGETLVVQPAEVRDWPDYKSRLIGTPFSEPLRGDWYGIRSAEQKGDLARARQLAAGWVAQQKHYFDWMLQAKMNMAWNRVNITPGDAPENTTIARAALKELHVYGLQRGIESMCADTTSIGNYPKDKDNPDFQDVVYHRSHHRYFCWSRLDYHRRRAERAARFLADAGYTGYYLHATDGGGWQNPALWKDRCELCRKTYGDDHAEADAVVFGIYYDEIKKRLPDIKFTAVVYPYSGDHLDPEIVYESASAAMGEGPSARKLAEQTSRDLTAFLERLNTLLPNDIYVCIRESERHPLDLIRNAWGDRPFHTYFEYAFWKGWRPYFVTTPLWTKGLYYPSHDDILYGSVGGTGWKELTQLLAAECAWNVDRPGAGEFDERAWLGIGTTLAPPPERETFALRACRFMFGNEAGPLMAPAFAENISRYYICFPEQVLSQVKVPDPVQTMAEQAQATARAADSLDRLWELQQGSDVLDAYQQKYFLNVYRMTHAARILADHRAHIMAAQRAIRQGKRKEVERELVAAAATLKPAGPRWETIKQRVQREQTLAWPARKTTTSGLLTQLDLKELEKEGSDLWDRREELIVQHTIPRWFDDVCRKREVTAVPAEGKITIDGRLDEAAWTKAPPIEHFIDYRLLRLESLETIARLVYDDKTLYAAFTCFDPDPSGIATAMSDRDRKGGCDSIEVLAASDSESKEFVHWMVDSQGDVFDARALSDSGGLSKYSSQWKSSAQVKATHDGDRWTVEMAIPAEELPFELKTGRTGAVLLCRNIVHIGPAGEEESNAIVYLDGSDFHTVEKFARLRFGSRPEAVVPPEVALNVAPIQFAHETTGDGAGTRIGGELRVETTRSLHNVHVAVRCTDGVEPLTEHEFSPVDWVGLMWRPQQPFSLLLPTEVPGVECTFTVASREGSWTFVRRFGKPRRADTPPDEMFAPGVDNLALARPAFFSSFNPQTLSIPEGTVEFWFKPRWDVTPRRSGPRGSLAHTLLNMGPIRPDHPYLSNYSSLTLSHSHHGSLSAVIANEHYESRSVGVSIRDWKKGQWHHVAIQWKLDDGGKTAMALYFDGKLVSDRCTNNKGSSAPGPLKMKQPQLPIQVGSMNTGFRSAAGEIDELRISSVRRYSESFTLQKRFSPDRHTTALFHFDGNLTAAFPPDYAATAGSAQ